MKKKYLNLKKYSTFLGFHRVLCERDSVKGNKMVTLIGSILEASLGRTTESGIELLLCVNHNCLPVSKLAKVEFVYPQLQLLWQLWLSFDAAVVVAVVAAVVVAVAVVVAGAVVQMLTSFE